MHTAGKYSTILLLLFSVTKPLFGQSEIGKTDSITSPDHGIIGAPFLRWTPETKLAGGAAGL